MKKFFAALIISTCLLACSENEKKDSNSTSIDSNSSSSNENNKSSREKEIADSTKMLDKKLADPNDPTTPDSLK